MKFIIKLFFPFLICLVLTSCDNDDDDKIYDLTFAHNSYAITLGQNTPISFRSGNLDYTFSSSDEEVATVTYTPPAHVGFGDIVLTGKKKGTTTVSVTDNVTKQKVELTITVVDAYLSLTNFQNEIQVEINNETDKAFIEKDIKENSFLKEDYIYSLVKNEDKTFYMFSSSKDMNEGKYVYTGTYEFEERESAPYLVFSYKEGDKNVIHTYKMGDTGIPIISAFFNLGWNFIRATSPPLYMLSLDEGLTESYKSNYPNLTNASINAQMRLNFTMYPEMPAELLK